MAWLVDDKLGARTTVQEIVRDGCILALVVLLALILRADGTMVEEINPHQT